MRRSIEEVDALKELILKTAETVFATKGYNDTRMEDIAAEMGISRGPLYYHYKNKSELFTATVEWHMQCALEDVRSTFLERGDRSLLQVFSQDLYGRSKALDFSTSAYNVIFGDGENMLEARHIWTEALAKMYDIKLQTLRDAQARGELRPEVTPEMCVDTLFILYGGIRSARLDLTLARQYNDMDIADLDKTINTMLRYCQEHLLA